MSFRDNYYSEKDGSATYVFYLFSVVLKSNGLFVEMKINLQAISSSQHSTCFDLWWVCTNEFQSTCQAVLAKRDLIEVFFKFSVDTSNG